MEMVTTFKELYDVAPLVALVLLALVLGLKIADHFTKQHINTLKEWIKSLRKDE